MYEKFYTENEREKVFFFKSTVMILKIENFTKMFVASKQNKINNQLLSITVWV